MNSPGSCRAIPFALFIAFLAVGPWLGDSNWIAIARGLAVAVLLILFWPRYTELRQGIAAAPAFLSVVTGLAVFALWIHLDSGWAVVGEMGKGFVPESAVQAALRLAGLALVVPVMEELFWRSFLMRWIDRRDFLGHDPASTSAMALVVTSVLFALAHTQWLAALVAGLAYGYIYVRTRNLWAPILSHATTNTTLGAWILATGQWQYW